MTFKYYATVISIVDGDTVRLDVDLGFYMRMGLKGRLAGINAPEGKLTTAAAYLHKNLEIGSRVFIETNKTQEKYGRWLVTIWNLDKWGQVMQPSINEMLVSEGHAERYTP